MTQQNQNDIHRAIAFRSGMAVTACGVMAQMDDATSVPHLVTCSTCRKSTPADSRDILARLRK